MKEKITVHANNRPDPEGIALFHTLSYNIYRHEMLVVCHRHRLYFHPALFDH